MKIYTNIIFRYTQFPAPSCYIGLFSLTKHNNIKIWGYEHKSSHVFDILRYPHLNYPICKEVRDFGCLSRGRFKIHFRESDISEAILLNDDHRFLLSLRTVTFDEVLIKTNAVLSLFEEFWNESL